MKTSTWVKEVNRKRNNHFQGIIRKQSEAPRQASYEEVRKEK
jgi:hypothetical protein